MSAETLVDAVVADLRQGLGVEDIAIRHRGRGVTEDHVRRIIAELRKCGALTSGFFAPLPGAA